MLCPLSEHAERIALCTADREWTYSELNASIHALCSQLNDVKADDRVAFIAHPTPATIMLFFALFRLGAIACPLSFRIPPEQIPRHLEALSARLIDPSTLSLEPKNSGPTSIHLDQLATFLFTSGSSATPKIACHRLSNHYYNALGVIEPLQLDSSSRWHLSLPLFHIGGIAILFRCFIRGACVSLIPDNCTHFSLVPTQLYRLLNQPFPHATCLLLGGAPIPPALLQQASHLPLFTTYGMTETSSIMVLCKENGPQFDLPYRELKIIDNEIHVRGKTLFQGYLNQPIDQNEWFPTKDLGRINADGKLEIIGRKDRQFISGGENIQPEEIEAALLAIPGIRQATVLPIADPEFGERPIAFIDDETGTHTLQTLRKELQNRLPGFKHPVKVFSYPNKNEMKPKVSELKVFVFADKVPLT